MTFVVVLLVVVVLAAVVLFIVRRRGSADSSVDSFRRHIDALGPEARRSVVDQVQSAAGRNPNADDQPDDAGDTSAPGSVEATGPTAAADDLPEGATDDMTGDTTDDGDGARGA